MLSLPDPQVGEFLSKFSCRNGDSVITMIYDMNPDLVNRSFTEVYLQDYVSGFVSSETYCPLMIKKLFPIASMARCFRSGNIFSA